MTMQSKDTIFALSTPYAKSAIAAIRISGSLSKKVLHVLTNSKTDDSDSALMPRVMYNGPIYDPVDKEQIDYCMYSYFLGPKSYTGEDMAEIYLHGGLAIINKLLSALGDLRGVRFAEPGEFTKRSFENGKINLTEAEGIGDLIDAKTEMQRKAAMRQSSGELALFFQQIRDAVLKAQGMLEALIDFPEEDIPQSVINNFNQEISFIKEKMLMQQSSSSRGVSIRQGINVAIIGPSNAGKSSLINYLSKRDVSIINSIAGTTRDVVENSLDIAGFPVVISDTAGLRDDIDNVNEIEKIGISKSQELFEVADIKIIMIDINKIHELGSSNFYVNIFNMVQKGDEFIILLNKIDQNIINSDKQVKAYEEHPKCKEAVQALCTMLKISSLKDKVPIICCSVLNEMNLKSVEKSLSDACSNIGGLAESPIINRKRHMQAVENCLSIIWKIEQESDIILKAEELRHMSHALSMLIGDIDVEQVLGEIFSNFCIGK